MCVVICATLYFVCLFVSLFVCVADMFLEEMKNKQAARDKRQSDRDSGKGGGGKMDSTELGTALSIYIYFFHRTALHCTTLLYKVHNTLSSVDRLFCIFLTHFCVCRS